MDAMARMMSNDCIHHPYEGGLDERHAKTLKSIEQGEYTGRCAVIERTRWIVDFISSLLVQYSNQAR